jgi:hypothetical protein
MLPAGMPKIGEVLYTASEHKPSWNSIGYIDEETLANVWQRLYNQIAPISGSI